MVFSDSYGKHVKLVQALVLRAEENGVALNQSKMVFAEQEVKFGGYIVDEKGFRPDPELTQAIRDFSSPLNATDLRSFFGVASTSRKFFR